MKAFEGVWMVFGLRQGFGPRLFVGMYDASSGDGLDEKKLKRLGLTGGRSNTRKEMQER